MKRATALVAAAAFALGATASYGAETVKTKATITEGGPSLFAGTVSSKKAKCEKGRKVSLIYEQGKGAGQVVGKAKTDAKGNWEMPGNYVAGLYHVEVKKKTVTVRDKRRFTEALCRFFAGEPHPF